eukprot:gene17792-18011_t
MTESKKSTLQHVAELAGVGIATVDRVLNERGNVSPKTAQHVILAARQLGLRRLLPSAYQKGIRIDVILTRPELPLIKRMSAAFATISSTVDRSVTIHRHILKDDNPKAFSKQLYASKAQGVIIYCREDDEVREAINHLSQAGKRVITVISDIRDAARFAYAGINHYAAGRTVGLFMTQMSRRSGNIIVLCNNIKYQGHAERIRGLTDVVQENGDHFTISDILEGKDEGSLSEALLTSALLNRRDVIGIYNAGAANLAVERAIRKVSPQQLLFIGHELTENTTRMLREKTMTLTLDQSPERQARSAVNLILSQFGYLDLTSSQHSGGEFTLPESFQNRQTEPHARWSSETAHALYSAPFNDLLFQAHTVHRVSFDPNRVQLSRLLSIKTGGCPEDCGYCSQSSRHGSGLRASKLAEVHHVISEAAKAKAAGATRYCMGAAWRSPKERDMEAVIAMVEGVKALGMETCMTLGMLDADQASRLKLAGLDYYNHNIDTSERFYPQVISTRTFAERLETLANVRDSGIKVCSGGILGMGETAQDRVDMLVTLANLPEPPDSVPINMLIPIKGTPLEDATKIDPLDFVRIIALARIMMPSSHVRLSAGRTDMSDEMQALCFFAGANSIFVGETLLTADNPGEDKDSSLFQRLGILPMEMNG